MPRLLPAVLTAIWAISATACGGGAIPEKALTLRNEGLAELENERPEEAERIFLELVEVYPDDPLGWANLALAGLRQQKSEAAVEWIDKALSKASGRGDLLAIKAEVLAWSGRESEAFDLFRQALERRPEDLEILYRLYRLGESLPGGETEGIDETRRGVLDDLARLRPENVVLLSQLGQRAIAGDDRAAASGAYLRLGELVWQGPEAVVRGLAGTREALEQASEEDLSAARIPALRLENVLKVTPMYQQSLRELVTGIQGIPVPRFVGERAPTVFGAPVPVAFRAAALSTEATAGGAVATGDFDGDGHPDVARVARGKAGGTPRLEIRLSGAPEGEITFPAPPGLEGLLAADLDNDGHLDLIAFGPGKLAAWRGLPGSEGAAFEPATEIFGLATASGRAAEVVDFDIEGDLDLVLAGGSKGIELWRNNLQGPLEEVGAKALPPAGETELRDVAASDLDRDGDLDLLFAYGNEKGGGLLWLDNLRQGRFADRTEEGGLSGAGAGTGAISAVESADLDGDGQPDLIAAAGDGLIFFHNRGGSFEPWKISMAAPAAGKLKTLLAFDADNDGRLDLAVAGDGGVAVLRQKPPLTFETVKVENAPEKAIALAAADLDDDGDLDLVAGGPEGLHRLENDGGNRNHWFRVSLRGLAAGSSKNNFFGVGSTVEVFAGGAYQFREARGDVTHLGLGAVRRPDNLRVVWTNGVPQHRLQPEPDQRVVEEQLLKGSCPFLYAWNGESFDFVTDLLWGAPIGMPVAPGVWAGADPEELVKIDGAVAVDGRYRMVVTEELWEAAFFDLLRLWVVDHPAEVEVASSLKILLGEIVPDKVLASRKLRPVAAAWDGRGRDVTETVRSRDEVYADGYEKSPYQGIARRPWAMTFDLGEAPADASQGIRLHLDGWIFPADASLNLAVAQRTDLAWIPPSLEVEVAGAWQPLMPKMAFPAGKTKTMVIDTPPLPKGARKLRIVTTQWLHWDRIAWTTARADEEPKIQARLEPEVANLRFRGFSRPYRDTPNGPHQFDYRETSTESPWLPFPGNYTRFGDVRELLKEPDDRSVILAPGDEIELTFNAGHLPPPPEGFKRTVFLESHGYDKDADRNTYEGNQLEPLPFRAMSGYPYGEGERFPETEELQEYQAEWLTRRVE